MNIFSHDYIALTTNFLLGSLATFVPLINYLYIGYTAYQYWKGHGDVTKDLIQYGAGWVIAKAVEYYF